MSIINYSTSLPYENINSVFINVTTSQYKKKKYSKKYIYESIIKMFSNFYASCNIKNTTKIVIVIKMQNFMRSVCLEISPLNPYPMLTNNIQENNIQENNIQENNIQENNIQENNIQENNTQENNIQENNSLDSNSSENDIEFHECFSGEFTPFVIDPIEHEHTQQWTKKEINCGEYIEQSSKHLTCANFMDTLKNYVLFQKDPILTDDIINRTITFIAEIVGGKTITFCKFQEMFDIITTHEDRIKQPYHFRTEIKSAMIINGDIHGSIESLFFPFFVNGLFGNDGTLQYLFLSDYLDRGPNGLECLTTLMVFKFLFPNNIFIVRGNHEENIVYMTYGTFAELRKKFTYNIGESIVIIEKMISCMSYAGTIHNKIFVCHGMPSEHTPFLDIINTNNLSEDEYKKISEALTWSDPMDTSEFSSECEIGEYSHNNIRGCGFLVPWNISQKFLHDNELDFVVRAHQCVMGGYQITQPSVITIFGCPNYCDCNNKAGFLVADPSGQITILSFTIDDVNTIITQHIVKDDPPPYIELDYFIA